MYCPTLYYTTHFPNFVRNSHFFTIIWSVHSSHNTTKWIFSLVKASFASYFQCLLNANKNHRFARVPINCRPVMHFGLRFCLFLFLHRCRLRRILLHFSYESSTMVLCSWMEISFHCSFTQNNATKNAHCEFIHGTNIYAAESALKRNSRHGNQNTDVRTEWTMKTKGWTK